MWILQLNNMRDSNDVYSPQACAATREDLVAYVKKELADRPYKEIGLYLGNPEYVFMKVFKKGSPLEYFNYPEPNCFIDIGDEETWAQNARLEFRNLMAHMQSMGALLTPEPPKTGLIIH